MRPWHRRSLTAGILAAGLVLTACTGIPTTGPIIEGDPIDTNPADQVIRVIARPPQPGMEPVEIVRGFLQASASFEGDHAVARQYLTPEAAALWNPGVGTVVYEGIPESTAAAVDKVTVTAPQIGLITEDGGYSVTPPGRTSTTSFTLARVGAEWRIALPPPGLLLSRIDVDRNYRSYNLYFLDPSFSTLVPDPRFIPISGPGVATSLIQRLVAGPSTWLAPAVRTAVPDGTTLAVEAVPIVDGIARVDLDAGARLTDDRTRQAMSAQITWTLRQLPGVAAIDIEAGGQTLDVPGVASPQPRDSWSAYDPNLMPTSTVPYLVTGGRVLAVDATGFALVPGGAGLGEPPLAGIAVRLDGEQIAGLDPDGAVFAADVVSGAATRPLLDEPGQSRPAYDREGAVWTIDAEGLIRRVRPDGTLVAVPIEGLAEEATPQSLAISRDGTRAALIIRRGPRAVVQVATVVTREGGVALASPRRVENRITAAIDVTWADDDRLVVVGSEGASTGQVYEVDLARANLRLLPSPPGAIRVAAAPGFPVLVGTEAGRIVSLTASRWQDFAFGGSPAYPG